MPSTNRIYLSPPHLSGKELAMLEDAVESNWIAPLGPHVDEFEREFAAKVGVPYAAAVSSGTAALHLALLVSGVGPDDVVLCSSFTFAATANAIVYAGATPVFVDSSPDTWNIDPDLVAMASRELAEEGDKPAALVAVDLYGQAADYGRLVPICESAGVVLIEDAAEALGASHDGRPVGYAGDTSIFSFNGNKIITSGGGGMLVSAAEDKVDRARFLATQARDAAPHYQHSMIGYNYRMSNLLAAVGRAQLEVLEHRVSARRRNFASYRELLSDLPGITFMPEARYGESNHWLTCITIDPEQFGVDREHVRLALEAENIESRPLWKPMHLQPVFANARMYGGDVSAGLFRDGLCLPSGSALTDADLERVSTIVRGLRR